MVICHVVVAKRNVCIRTNLSLTKSESSENFLRASYEVQNCQSAADYAGTFNLAEIIFDVFPLGKLVDVWNPLQNLIISSKNLRTGFNYTAVYL